jgi:hypothetical protein
MGRQSCLLGFLSEQKVMKCGSDTSLISFEVPDKYIDLFKSHQTYDMIELQQDRYFSEGLRI